MFGKSKIILLFFFPSAIVSLLAQNYGYNYDYSFWKNTKPAPPAYYVRQTFTGSDFGLDAFVELADVYAFEEKIYILDSDNARLCIFDNQWNLIQEIKTFPNNGRNDSFLSPEAVAVSSRSIIIADTGNRRLVKFSLDGEFTAVINKPQTAALQEVDFKVTDLTIDQSGNIYILIRGVYEGIIELNYDGTFSRFTGVNKVKFNFGDYLWKTFATDAQRAQMQLFIPVTFSGIRIDESGFLYAVSPEENINDPIKKINPKGEDVLRHDSLNKFFGDIVYRNIDEPHGGPTAFVGIAVNNYGIYSALDNTMGRIFTYDEGGELLYISGGYGEQKGLYRRPVAIEYTTNDDLIVLDAGNLQITVLSLTEYGGALNKASRLIYNGDYEKSEFWWKKVLSLNGNYEPAYTGLGKLSLRRHEYKKAVEYFKLGNNKMYYSRAFQRYRREVLRKNFHWIMSVLTLLLFFFIIFSVKKLIWKES